MAMNRVVNDPNQVVEDMLIGWLSAHDDTLCAKVDNPRVVQRRAAPEVGKVGMVTGGGSGHEPAFLGYVGEGLLDAVAVGEIFSSPTAKNFLDAIRAADGGAGVACLYGNYEGDNMNVKMAIQMAAQEGIFVQTVVANDDVPSAPKGDEAKRRGVAGEIFMWKVGAAKAAMGASLEEVITVAQKAINNTRSIGVGLSACVIPAAGKANFTIEPGNMEVGIGHHGELGIDVRLTCSASEMAELMLATVLPDLPFVDGDRVAVLISGLGATPIMEQYILFGEIDKRLKTMGIRVKFKQVGNLFTSLEMMGVTLTLMKIDDDLEACLKHPCQSVGLTVVGQKGNAVAYSGKAHATMIRNVAEVQVHHQQRKLSGATVPLSKAGFLVRNLISTIVSNREYLSEIDGLIGDGDHGINMAKGFISCATRLDALGERADDLRIALTELSKALMDDIGGSMGPLYGNFFLGFVAALDAYTDMDAKLFSEALTAAVKNVQSTGNAQVGDKTLIDTLVPARDAFESAIANMNGFSSALQAMSEAAERGKNSTKDLQARIGRSARLGPRSIGVFDAGATSCCLLLQSLASSLQGQLNSIDR